MGLGLNVADVETVQSLIDSNTSTASFEPFATYKRDTVKASLYHGDCMDVMRQLITEYPEGMVDMIFADPPYFLSNDGISCQSGRMVSVNKGGWDRSLGAEENHRFNLEWLGLCQKLLKPNGTLWVSGTMHVIFSIGYAMQQLGYKMLNDIIWEKPNPPPNLACRYFTHSTETVLWAAKNAKSKHVFHYDAMKEENAGKQMKSVWRFTAPLQQEKNHGKHPTQKPLALLERCILSSTSQNDVVMDPFSGSGTTGVAAVLAKRSFVGIEKEKNYIELSQRRIQDVIQPEGLLFS